MAIADINERNEVRQSIIAQQDDARQYPEASRFPPQIFSGFSRLRRAFETGDKREAEQSRRDLGLTREAVEFAKSVFAEIPEYDRQLAAAREEQGRCHAMQSELAAIEGKRKSQGFLSAHDAERYLSIERRFLAANSNANVLLGADPRKIVAELWCEDSPVNSQRMFVVRNGTYSNNAELVNRLLALGCDPRRQRWTSIGLKASDRLWWETEAERKERVEAMKNQRPAFENWMPVDQSPRQSQHREHDRIRVPSAPRLGGAY